MKQETGSNTRQSAQKVSIQLALDGHSFSVSGMETISEGDAPVEVEVLTMRTTLLPEALFEAAYATEALAATGLAATAGEQVIHSAPHEGIIAVMAAPREALHGVEEQLRARIRYTTPLLRSLTTLKPTVWCYRVGPLVYIKVYTAGALRMAEVIRAADEAEILYFMARLSSEFPLREMQLRLAGVFGKELRRTLKKSFKQLLCES